VKKRILDDAAGRKALWEQLQFALDGEPDPWFEFEKAQVDLRQFAPLQPAVDTAKERLRRSDERSWHPPGDICRVDDIPCWARAAWRAAAGLPVAVFRTADDQVFALLDRCPHKGGPLSQGIVAASSVACPLHNWTIGLADGRPARPTRAARRASLRKVEAAGCC
jgi:nitrite reductase (NADH) small subunit